MIDVGGEWLEGFHVEAVPQYVDADTYSEDALGWRAGIRAVWLLYRRGKWELLAELGMDAEMLRCKLHPFAHYDDQLTEGQVRWLRDRIPELETASFRLRALYALKYRLQEMHMKQQVEDQERIYLADVYDQTEPAKSDANARRLVEQYREAIQAVDGAVDLAPARGNGPAIIRVITRGRCAGADPADMFPGEGLTFKQVFGVTIQIPKGAVELPNDEPTAEA